MVATRRALVLAFVLGMAVTVLPTASVGAASPPVIEFRRSAATVEFMRYRFPGDGGAPLAYGELPATVGARNAAWRLEVTRKPYASPITVVQTSPGALRTLGTGLTDGWHGLDDFLKIRVTDGSGKVRLQEMRTFCPNSWSGERLGPDSSDVQTFPSYCGGHSLTQGMVWGIDAGWAVPAGSLELALPNGRYTGRAEITKPWRERLGLTWQQANVQFTIVVKTVWFDGSGEGDGVVTSSASSAGTTGPSMQPSPNPDGPQASPTAARTAAAAPAIPDSAKPDLRALPAFGMAAYSEGSRDLLAFGANVWNAGPGPLVVDGFRRSGSQTMDAYQQFYDLNGRRVGNYKKGTFEFHNGGGHNHWHYEDFARYDLLGADKQQVRRSGKQAFCLAPTDPIDLTLVGAHMRPENSDLRTACGGATAQSLREVLPSGWGDTYTQGVAGQAFDVTELANGTYYVRVVANPLGNVIEGRSDNNVALRKIVLGGTRGSRTVQVPPFEGIDTESQLGWGGF